MQNSDAQGYPTDGGGSRLTHPAPMVSALSWNVVVRTSQAHLREQGISLFSVTSAQLSVAMSEPEGCT